MGGLTRVALAVGAWPQQEESTCSSFLSALAPFSCIFLTAFCRTNDVREVFAGQRIQELNFGAVMDDLKHKT